MRGAVIFDRDGVLNQDVGYAHLPDQIVWLDGAAAAVKAVNDLGLFAFVATNQSGVARGYYPESDVEALHDWMQAELALFGARIDAFVYSPFHPQASVEAYRRDSSCRKPGPGMIVELLQRFPVDASRTVLIGDKPSDMAAAGAAGIEGLLYTGGSVLAALRPVLDRISSAPESAAPPSQLAPHPGG